MYRRLVIGSIPILSTKPPVLGYGHLVWDKAAFQLKNGMGEIPRWFDSIIQKLCAVGLAIEDRQAIEDRNSERSQRNRYYHLV